MITGFLLSAVYAILAGLLYLLPAGGEIPTAITNGATQLGGMLYAWNLLLPISEFVTIFGIAVTIVIGVFTVRSIMYVVALFRGNSMPGAV